MTLRRLRKWGWEIAHNPLVYWLIAPFYHRLVAPIYRAGLSSKLYIKKRLAKSLRVSLKRRGQGRVSLTLRQLIWMMNQTYRPAQSVKTSLGSEFDAILSRIATSSQISPSELLPYLCLPHCTERSVVNAMLADAYLQREMPEDLRQASVFIKRAWLLSGFSQEMLPLYTKICGALNDARAMREAYKRLGMAAAAEKNIPEAIHYFDLSHYAELGFNHLDRYEFDFDILNCMDQLAAPFRFAPRTRAVSADDGKIRLAYLVKGMTELNSILVEINLIMAKHHDKSRFEITFFIPETEELIAISKQAKERVRAFESFGCRVVLAPKMENPADSLVALARSIYDSEPHIFISSAALANFTQYFITSLRPAPIVMGLIQGPPPQFSPPILDWGIAWTRHPQMDSPVDCSIVILRLDYKEQGNISAYSRSELDLPDEATVLLSGGRFPKFQEQEFWSSIAELLAKYTDAYYLAVGPRKDQIPFFEAVVPTAVRPRVRCLGWRGDFQRILPVADVVVDTYPSGGGQVIVQAMSQGIPFVSHRNDYMQIYDQTNWSPIEEFIPEAEVIVPRGDFNRVKEVVSKLIEDEDYRRQVGERCKTAYFSTADSERAVRQCEEIYTTVLERFSPLARSV